jgi:site-specific DNA recombinase
MAPTTQSAFAANGRRTVIYTRFSSVGQRPESCQDQERNVRESLTRRMIDHSNALVLADEAQAGDKTSRVGFTQLREMIQRGEVNLLAVDDQGRFDRGDNALHPIKDLVFASGRFISTGENIDTALEGWELLVKAMDLHHSTANRERARQVRRGQEGRVLDGGSAGDFPFGYRSEFLEPAAAAAYTGRRPRPKKRIVIDEEQAQIVRGIFASFVAGQSVHAIARALTAAGVSNGPGMGCRWDPLRVRRILNNAKYAGRWCWGKTRTLRNSAGKKKQVPVESSRVVVVGRPELRILDNETWLKAQARLKALREQFGWKPGQRRRAPRVHRTSIYSCGLLNGLVYCRNCEARSHALCLDGREYVPCDECRRAA